MTLFRGINGIIKLGKWAFFRIPNGNRCSGCPMLDKWSMSSPESIHWHCGLRPIYNLLHDNEGPFKDGACSEED